MAYAKFISETEIDRNPPRSATIDGCLVTGILPREYLATLGYIPFADTPMPDTEPTAGNHWEERFSIVSGVICNTWVEAPDVAPVRSISKRKLMNVLKAVNLWTPIKGYMEQNDLWDDFAMATTLDDNDPLLTQAITALVSGGILTAEQAATIIDNSVSED